MIYTKNLTDDEYERLHTMFAYSDNFRKAMYDNRDCHTSLSYDGNEVVFALCGIIFFDGGDGPSPRPIWIVTIIDDVKQLILKVEDEVSG